MLPGTSLVLVFAVLGAVILLARDAWEYRRAYKQETVRGRVAAERPLVVVANATAPPRPSAPGGDKSA